MSNEAKYVEWLMRVVKSQRSSRQRSKLSRGDIVQCEPQADSVILRQASNKRLEARRLHAALIAQNPRIIHSPRGKTIGEVIRDLTRGEKRMSEDGMADRIVAIQRQSLPQAHKTFKTLLAKASTTGKPLVLNVESLLWTYLKWNEGAPVFPMRREVLHKFYATPTTTATPTDAESHDTNGKA